jgi:acetyltransferase-like isoleucine patch superfamily enzyme
MSRVLSLIAGERYRRFYSLIMKQILLSKGIRIGKNFRISGVPDLKIHGQPSNIIIGNNVTVSGNIELKNREEGSIIIEDDVTIDRDCRFVSANDAVLRIGRGTKVGFSNVFNCGADLSFGQKCITAGVVYINSSEHNIKRSEFILDQGYYHAAISIGDDVWIGGFVVIKQGVRIGDGAVIGASAVVTKNLPPYSINVGNPSRTIGYRT